MNLGISKLHPVALSLVSLFLMGGSAFAEYCPVFYAGSWNGVHYHYCRKKNQCDYPLYYVVSDARQHQTASCAECDDPIAGEGDPDEAAETPEDDETDLVAIRKKSEGITAYVKKHTGNKPGNESTSGPSFPGGQFFAPGPHVRVARDEVVKVQGENRFFRVLTIVSKLDEQKLIARVGQELAENPGGTVIQGVRIDQNGDDSLIWKIRVTKAGKNRYFYVNLKTP